MWQFAEITRGLADGCRALGLPVTGGNVSFYNSTGAVPINPTPVVGVLGVMADVARRTPIGFRHPGEAVYLLGRTEEEFGGSEWAWVVHQHLGGRPPRVDFGAEQRLAGVCAQAADEGLLGAAHDLSDGGLAQALVECCLRYGVGAEVEPDLGPAAARRPPPGRPTRRRAPRRDPPPARDPAPPRHRPRTAGSTP